MSELLSPPGSDEWFRAAILTANRRRWRRLMATSGAALSCTMLLALGPMTHPSADQPMEIVTPPSPSPTPVAAPPRGTGPAVPVPTPAAAVGGRTARGAVRPPAPAPAPPAREPRFGPMRESRQNAFACLTVGAWCVNAGRGTQSRGGDMPLTAEMCAMGSADHLVFETDLEVDFVIETTSRVVVARLSDVQPPKPQPHTLEWNAPGVCYRWSTWWSGERTDGRRIPGAYVLRVVPRTDSARFVTTYDWIRFDLT